MPSNALSALYEALAEVRALQRANPSPVGGEPGDPDVTRVIGRASVVLLSSHFERYIRSINAEAVDYLNSKVILACDVPRDLRLLHAKQVVVDLAETAWEGEARATKLTEFAMTEARLWQQGGVGVVHHGRLLAWMKSPKPDELVRYFRYWGIQNIFEAITRKAHTKAHFYLKLGELVDKRNNIAHGDLTTEATQADVNSYILAVSEFCTRVDKRLARCMARICKAENPW